MPTSYRRRWILFLLSRWDSQQLVYAFGVRSKKRATTRRKPGLYSRGKSLRFPCALKLASELSCILHLVLHPDHQPLFLNLPYASGTASFRRLIGFSVLCSARGLSLIFVLFTDVLGWQLWGRKTGLKRGCGRRP